MKITADTLMNEFEREFAYFAPAPREGSKSLFQALEQIAERLNAHVETVPKPVVVIECQGDA